MCSIVGKKETIYIVTLVRDFASAFINQPIMSNPHIYKTILVLDIIYLDRRQKHVSDKVIVS